MRRDGLLRGVMWVAVVCLVGVGMSAAAFGAGGDKYKKQAAQFDKMLEKQAKADQGDAAADDIDRARAWLENAKVLLAKGDADAAGRLLRRVKFSLDLIAAVVQAGNIQQAADEQEAAFYKAKQTQLPELKAKIQSLKDDKKKLNRELRTLE